VRQLGEERLCVRALPLNEPNDLLQGCLVAVQHGDVVRRRGATERRVSQAGRDVSKPTAARSLELDEQGQARLRGQKAGRMPGVVCREL
jgi:hypothetical protein